MNKEIIKLASNLFKEDIKTNSKINDFDKWDSLGQLTLFLELESEFSVKFTPEEIIETNIMSDIIDLVDKKLT